MSDDREDKDRAYRKTMAAEHNREIAQLEQRIREAEQNSLKYAATQEKIAAAERARMAPVYVHRPVAGHDRRQEEEDMIERSRRQTRRMSRR